MNTLALRKFAPIITLLVLTGSVRGHQEWTRSNDVTSNTLALYHFDEEVESPVKPINAAGCLPDSRDLVVGFPVGAGIEVDHDTAEPFLGPHALKFNSAQSAESTAILPSDGDVSIEFWLKWDAALTSSSIEIGWRSSAKLRITRDTANPANDQFGVFGTHGDYRPAPGFTTWAALNPSGSHLGNWRHYALAIHSTGQHYDEVKAHDVYNTGTVARLLSNGHPISEPDELDLTGLQVHDTSKIIIRNIAGSVSIDEVVIWNSDLTLDGAIENPYSDGRGDGTCFVGADFNSDNCTDINDFLILLDNWQTTYLGQLLDITVFLELIDNWQTGPGCQP